MTFAPYESLLNVTKCVRCRLVLLDSMGKLENKSLEICHLQSFIKHSFSLSPRISDKWIRMTSACRLMWLEMWAEMWGESVPDASIARACLDRDLTHFINAHNLFIDIGIFLHQIHFTLRWDVQTYSIFCNGEIMGRGDTFKLNQQLPCFVSVNCQASKAADLRVLLEQHSYQLASNLWKISNS